MQEAISQRDLRLRSKEIMDAVEAGNSFSVTRGGHQVGELVPVRPRPRFVRRADFARSSQAAPVIDLARFREDQDAALDGGLADPYER